MAKKGKKKSFSSKKKRSARVASRQVRAGMDSLHAQVHSKIQMKPVMWIISVFMTYLAIHYSLYAIKYSTNLEASALIMLILGSLAYVTCPLTAMNR